MAPKTKTSAPAKKTGGNIPSKMKAGMGMSNGVKPGKAKGC